MDKIDEYKKPGEIVRFRIGPYYAFGRGLETDIRGNTIFDLLETMGYRRKVVINEENKDTAVDFDLISEPDKGYYSVVDMASSNEKVYESSYINQEGDPDYDFYSPNITGEIKNGIPPTSEPVVGDLYLVTESDFNPDGTPFSVGTVVKNTTSPPGDVTWATAQTSRPIDFAFFNQIGDITGYTDLENNEIIYELPVILDYVNIESLTPNSSDGLYYIISGNNTYPTRSIVEVISGSLSNWIPPTTIQNVSTEFGPIIINQINILDENLILTVKDNKGVIRAETDIMLTAILVDIDPRIDRLVGRGKLKSNIFTINVSGVFNPGDTIFARYKHFTHTDMLRDRDTGSIWKTMNGISDSEIIIDFSYPNGGPSVIPYNNFHLISSEKGISMGGKNFIAHIGNVDSNGNLRFKHWKDGVIENIKSGEMAVIKFPETAARFLKINIFNSCNDGFYAVTISVRDPALANLGRDVDSSLTKDDFHGVSIIPYFHNKESDEVKSATITIGQEVMVVEIVGNGLGRVYIPVKYNGLDQDKIDFDLFYFDIKYFGETVYNGIPADKNSNLREIISIGVDYSGTFPLDIKKDILISNTNGANRTANTIFSQIEDGPVTINQVSNSFSINSPKSAFFQGDNVIICYEESGTIRVMLMGGPKEGDGISFPEEGFVIIDSDSQSPDMITLLSNSYVIAWKKNETGIRFTIREASAPPTAVVDVIDNSQYLENPIIGELLNIESNISFGFYIVSFHSTANALYLNTIENSNPITQHSSLITYATSDFSTTSVGDSTFLVARVTTEGNLYIGRYDKEANLLLSSSFNNDTLIASNVRSPSMCEIENKLIIIAYIKSNNKIGIKYFTKSGIQLSNSSPEKEITSLLEVLSEVKIIPSETNKNFIISYKKDGSGYFFQEIEVNIVALTENRFRVEKPLTFEDLSSLSPSVNVFKNNILMSFPVDFSLSINGDSIIINAGTVPNDIILITPVVSTSFGEITITNDASQSELSIARDKFIGDNYLFAWKNSSGHFQLRYYIKNTFKLYYSNENVSNIRMFPGNGAKGEFTLNKRSGKIVFANNGNPGVFQPYGSDGVNYKIHATYNYKLKKQSEASPQRLLEYFGSRRFEEFIAYAGLRVYPTYLFAEYLENKIASIFRFKNNPATEDISFETGGGTTRLLNNKRVRDKIGETKEVIAYSGERIDKEFADQLKYWHDAAEEITIVDDMRKARTGFILPDSLSTSRRPTSKEEQDNETGSYKYSFTFQES